MLMCARCRHVGDSTEFRFGRGRQYGEHPEHRYCPACGESIDWYGYSYVKGGEKECAPQLESATTSRS